jgi:excisionase family DNA binding protein
MDAVHKHTLSTSDVARLFEVTETTIKRWADGGELPCDKTPGGHRKFHLPSVLDFAKSNGLHLPALPWTELPGRVSAAIDAGDFEALNDTLLTEALSERPGAVTDFILGLLYANIPIAAVADNVIQGTMRRIGDLWLAGDVGADMEHRVSYELMNAISRFESYRAPSPRTPQRILLACPSGEWHELGLRIIAGMVRLEGWEVVYLGASNPGHDIIRAVATHRPAVTCLSITRSDTTPERQAELREIYRAIRDTDGRLVLGGPGTNRRYADARICDAVRTSATGLLEYLRSTIPSSPVVA